LIPARLEFAKSSWVIHIWVKEILTGQEGRKKSLVIYHLTFFICHFCLRGLRLGFAESANGTQSLNLKMTNEKCQMIYDQ
jgi:hypothetical protein